MNSNGTRNKLLDFIKSPLGVGALIIIASLIVLVAISRSKLLSSRTYSYDEMIKYEYDPASQTEISFLPPTNGGDGVPSIYYVAENEIVDDGVPVQHWVVLKYVIEEFAREKNIELFRVSYLHDSYNLAATYVFDFKAVLNIDQQTISARIDASKNWDDILGSIYILSDEAGNELYRFEVTEENKCQFDGTCSGD